MHQFLSVSLKHGLQRLLKMKEVELEIHIKPIKSYFL